MMKALVQVHLPILIYTIRLLGYYFFTTNTKTSFFLIFNNNKITQKFHQIGIGGKLSHNVPLQHEKFPSQSSKGRKFEIECKKLKIIYFFSTK